MREFNYFFEANILEMDIDQREKFKSIHGYDPIKKSKIKNLLPDIPTRIDTPTEPIKEPETQPEEMTTNIPTGFTSMADGAFLF